MFLFITEEVMNDPKLFPTEKLIYGLIKSFDYQGKVFYMSNNQIASNIGVSVRQVIRTIQKLESLNYIKVTYESSKGVHSNRIITVVRVRHELKRDSELQKLFDKVYEKIK